MDNDDAGNSACLRIAKELKEQYPSVSVYRLSPEHKDFNEDLQAWRAEQEMTESAVTVYLYFRERSNKDGICFPSIPIVSRDTGLSEATVKRAIQDLTAAGWLQKEPRLRRNGARSSNLYLLKH